VVDKSEESRRFYAYINRNGTLHNNGMWTGAFIAHLERELDRCPLYRGREDDRSMSSSPWRTPAKSCRWVSASWVWPTSKGLEKLGGL